MKKIRVVLPSEKAFEAQLEPKGKALYRLEVERLIETGTLTTPFWGYVSGVSLSRDEINALIQVCQAALSGEAS